MNLSQQLFEAVKRVNRLDQIKQELLANDPATYGDYGEYEFSGSLQQRVSEIIYNHGWEAGNAAKGGDKQVVARSEKAMKNLFALAKREGFGPKAKRDWSSGVKDGNG